MKKIFPLFVLAVIAMAQTAYSQATIDFTTYSNIDSETSDPINSVINNWILGLEFDGFGGFEGFATDGIDVDPTGAGGAVTISGTAPIGITGTFTIVLDGTSNAGTETEVRIDGDGSGVGVVGRNAGRIDWNPDLDSMSEVMDMEFDATTLSGANVVVTGMSFVSLDAPADPKLTDLLATDTTYAEGTTSVTLGGTGWTIDSGTDGVAALSDSTSNGVNELQGFALGGITLDFVVNDQPTLEIDRSTGSATLKNTTSTTFEDIWGMEILSLTDSLDPTGWNSVAENYDSDSGGTFDSGTVWYEASDTVSKLAEGNFSSGTTSLAPGASFDLGTIYTPGSDEDVFLIFKTDDGTIPADLWANTIYVGLVPLTDGDFNEDGIVNNDDFLVWQRGGSPNPLSQEDLEIWQDTYGQTIVAASAVTVPEPSAIMLTLFAIGLAGATRCRS